MSPRDKARKAIGGLSRPSKMPCPSWSIDARLCNVGGKLHKEEGSVCSGCYALKNMYVMPNVRKAMKRRYNIWLKDRAAWRTNFIAALEGEKWFRWFDSGDIQGLDMLYDIAYVAEHTPHTQHWLPTKENFVVAQYREAFLPPSNLTIRLSMPMVDQPRPAMLKTGLLTSGVTTGKESCPAKQQGHKCLSCRTCWNQNVAHVTYAKH